MIFIDSNIPMYLIGADHPLKASTQVLVESLIAKQIKFVTDAEVLQEILHRYVAINRRDSIQLCIDALYTLVDEIYPIQEADVIRAKDLVASYPKISARYAIHVAIAKRHGVKEILSHDRGFDHIPWMTRLS